MSRLLRRVVVTKSCKKVSSNFLRYLSIWKIMSIAGCAWQIINNQWAVPKFKTLQLRKPRNPNAYTRAFSQRNIVVEFYKGLVIELHLVIPVMLLSLETFPLMFLKLNSSTSASAELQQFNACMEFTSIPLSITHLSLYQHLYKSNPM